MGKGKYPKYKSSKILWQEQIPSHWQEAELRMLFSDNKNKNIGLVEKNLLSLSYGKLKRKDIDNATGLVPASFEGYQIIDEGYIVLRFTDLQNDKKSLRVGYANEKGIITNAYIGLKPKIDIHSKYFYYQLHFLDTIKYFYNLGGGVRQSLAFNEFGREILLIPEKSEQIKISKYLDFKLTQIDHLIKSKKRLLELFIERRKSLTNKILSSKYTKYYRLDIVAPNTQRPITRLENEIYTPIGLFNRGRGLFHKLKTKGSELGDSRFFNINAGDLILSGQFAWEGAVALATAADDGCIASHRYPILKCDEKFLVPEFLYSYFTSSEGHFLLEYHSRGAAGRNRPLNPRSIMKEKIAIPPLELQKSVSEMVRKEFILRKNIGKEVSLLLEYKNKLISDLITGQKDVNIIAVPEMLDEVSFDDIDEELDSEIESDVENETDEIEL